MNHAIEIIQKLNQSLRNLDLRTQENRDQFAAVILNDNQGGLDYKTLKKRFQEQTHLRLLVVDGQHRMAAFKKLLLGKAQSSNSNWLQSSRVDLVAPRAKPKVKNHFKLLRFISAFYCGGQSQGQGVDLLSVLELVDSNLNSMKSTRWTPSFYNVDNTTSRSKY